MNRPAAVIVWILCVLGAPVWTSADETAPFSQPNDIVCGPRCVQFLLTYYDKPGDRDLLALVREIQFPNVSEGATLKALSDFLRSQNVYTRMIHLSEDADLDWPYPAIVLWETEKQKLGHYVVWLPESVDSPQTEIWAGLEGRQTLDKDAFRERSTGDVLLTSPVPIDEVKKKEPASLNLTRQRVGEILLGAVITAMATAGMLWLIESWLKRRRENSDYGERDR